MPVTKAGRVRVHGPLSNRCAGSGMSSTTLSTSTVIDPGPTSSDTLSSSDPHFQPSYARILKRIPRASRHLAATKLAGILNEITEKNEISSWSQLATFSTRFFSVQKRGGRGRSLASAVNAQLRDESLTQPHPSQRQPGLYKPRDPQSLLATQVSSKLEEGDYKGAVRLTCSEDTIAVINDENLSAIRAKHPPRHPDTSFPLPIEDPPNISPLSEREILKAIRSFPCGSAGGPDGLRPQHLKDLTSASAERGGKELLGALASFTLHVMEGSTPCEVQPFFFGASLIPLKKKDGGIRPIAVGQTLRRLAAKCASFRATGSMSALLAPHQLGVGIPLGCEAAAHAARIFLHDMVTGNVLLKLDVSNAFNTLRRDKMLSAVKDVAPDLFRFVYSAYARPSSLYCGNHVISSAEGVQQGDPLGPLLFCLTIHPIVSRLKSCFTVFYLDDGSLGGPVQDVLSDLRLVEEEAAKLGLQLNYSKSELICDDPSSRDEMLLEAPSLRCVSCAQATLLGTPIGDITSVDDSVQEKVEVLKRMGERLTSLQSHDALTLLRHSFAIPKILYVLRTAPCFLSSHLQSFDESLRDILMSIVNVHLDDVSWLQASLPVRVGGIGIRRATQLAPSAYLASAAGCSDLVHQILPPSPSPVSPNPLLEAALTSWKEGHSHPPPGFPESRKQKSWDTPRIEATLAGLLEAADETTQARLLAVSCPEAGAWLNAFPISSVGLRMDNDVVRIAVGLRLGLPLCHPHACSDCGAQVNEFGSHGLSCRFSRGRHSRHASLNDIIKRSLATAKVPSHLEPAGLYRADGKRPDGASVVPWKRGRILVWDATCVDTLAPSYRSLAASGSGAVADDAEHRKKARYAHLEATHLFTPVAIETLGAFGQEARSFLRELAHRMSLSTGEPQSHQFLIQRVAVAVQRGNAASILGSVMARDNLDLSL